MKRKHTFDVCTLYTNKTTHLVIFCFSIENLPGQWPRLEEAGTEPLTVFRDCFGGIWDKELEFGLPYIFETYMYVATVTYPRGGYGPPCAPSGGPSGPEIYFFNIGQNVYSE